MAAPHVGLIGGLGLGEILVIGIVALLVYGRKLPDVARSLGKGMAEFRRGLAGVEQQLRDADYVPLPAPPAPRDAQPRIDRPAPAPPHPAAAARPHPARARPGSSWRGRAWAAGTPRGRWSSATWTATATTTCLR